MEKLTFKFIMTRAEIIQVLKGAMIEDILETDVWRENEPLVICGFTTKDGHTVYLKSIANSESVELSVGHPAEEAELRSFKEKLAAALPNSFFDFNARYLALEDIRRMVSAHAKEIKASGCGANETYRGMIRVRLDEKVIR
jgi:hypothetical protein